MADAIPFKPAPGLLDLLRGEAQDNYAAATPLIDILRKYGLAGLMAGGAMSQSGGKDN